MEGAMEALIVACVTFLWGAGTFLICCHSPAVKGVAPGLFNKRSEREKSPLEIPARNMCFGERSSFYHLLDLTESQR
jgi:hypothetical protein